MYELIRHPAWVERLRKALAENPDVPASERLSQIPRLEHFVSETLRFHPSAPIDLVQLHSDSPVSLPNGAVVEPEAIVFWSPWAMNRDKNVFGADAEEFDPERWEFMHKRPTAFEMPTFHGGARSCLGQAMARLEMGYVVAEVVARYDLTAAWEGERRLSKAGLGGEMQDGLPVRVRLRAGRGDV